jgi:ubiquinone/menaquinone biosynthesis C-methylase UbiE
VDIHPLAIQKVQRIISKKHLTNVKTIISDCRTGLSDNSLDAVIIYDAFHHLSDPNGVLKELHRVLKPGGILSFGDHHMKENEVVAAVTSNGLFRLSRKGQRTYTFLRNR